MWAAEGAWGLITFSLIDPRTAGWFFSSLIPTEERRHCWMGWACGCRHCQRDTLKHCIPHSRSPGPGANKPCLGWGCDCMKQWEQCWQGTAALLWVIETSVLTTPVGSDWLANITLHFWHLFQSKWVSPATGCLMWDLNNISVWLESPHLIFCCDVTTTDPLLPSGQDYLNKTLF